MWPFKKKRIPEKYEHTQDDYDKNYFVKNINNKLYVLSNSEVAIRLWDGSFVDERGNPFPQHYLFVPFLRFAFEFMRAVGTVKSPDVREWDRFDNHELDQIMFSIPEPIKFL